MQVELRLTQANTLWWRHVCTTAEHDIDARVVHAAARDDWAQGHRHAAAAAHPGPQPGSHVHRHAATTAVPSPRALAIMCYHRRHSRQRPR
jgi:hypothetical protein